MKRIGIVGGGIGALTAALILTKQGKSVEIFEKSHKLGGRLSFVERDGYRIDEGPTIVLLPNMIREILEEAGISSSQYELIPCDPLYTLFYRDGTTYTKYRDIEKQLQELERVFPEDKDGFLRFLNDMRMRFIIGKPAFLERSFVQKRSFFTYENMKTLVKLKAYQNTKKMMESYFQNEKLQEAYSLQTLYIGGNPAATPAIYSLVSFSEHEYGIWYVKGGYASLVQTLKEELKKRDVNIHYGVEVTGIRVEQNTATGIEVNASYYPFDAVLVNGDYPTMLPLLGKEAQMKNYTPSSGCVLLYFGLNKKYDSQIHQFFLSDDMDLHMKQVFQTKEVPEDPSFYTFYPSAIDDSLAPAGKSVLYTLVPVPSGDIDWSKEEVFVEDIITRMEENGFPSLRKHIEWMHVKTPNDAEREGLFAGGSFGIAPILFQSGAFRPQVKPLDIANLYAVGASIHPGGGIPIVMQGAKLAADAILNKGVEQIDFIRKGV
ncbi:phytoene desaturase family protein [Ectobacillus antri]|jgi:phytoene desaturase|uniref:Phytoene desaturase family protein n=1 Tax=Ectobacillus antri TaxID=2486280 RepID=A0ABT6H401_9BACI|nr:phytoene desaturase family protein [Ectobacillus antri]MDG4656698.1 phytoene desaturase family protein [Ectobacillus antri]MDG5753939.1 phytoene desaturase family protein [Ectobacillus antri]